MSNKTSADMYFNNYKFLFSVRRLSSLDIEQEIYNDGDILEQLIMCNIKKVQKLLHAG